MFRRLAVASNTGRVGRGADADSLAPCEKSVYRRSRGLARRGDELVVESHEQKQRNRKVVVVVAEQAASEQSRTTTTATGMVGRILTAAAAEISERSPTPQASSQARRAFCDELQRLEGFFTPEDRSATMGCKLSP